MANRWVSFSKAQVGNVVSEPCRCKEWEKEALCKITNNDN